MLLPLLWAPAATRGIGLQIMRYRARLLGGLLDVRRSSGGGTIVRSVLPRCCESSN
jgi:signal transduction histidine kinase